jgi:hypothetical protein
MRLTDDGDERARQYMASRADRHAPRDRGELPGHDVPDDDLDEAHTNDQGRYGD